MKRLEIRLFVDIDEKQTTTDDVVFHLETAIDDILDGTVRRADLIDEIEVA